jgi:uncharacterized protein YlxW (UPF0749 family)
VTHAIRRPRSQLALAAVALVLGVLVVVQIRAQGGGSRLDSLSAQELTDVVANLNTRNEQLRSEIASTQAEADQLRSAESRGDTSIGQLQSDLGRLQAWAGLLPVSGPGVRVTLDGGVPGSAVDDLINELHNAGAEALAVGGVRIVPGSVVAGDPGDLSIENTPLLGSVTVEAVGQPPALTGSLTRAGGIVAQLKATFPGVQVTVEPVDHLVVPATDRSLVPSHGTPRL